MSFMRFHLFEYGFSCRKVDSKNQCLSTKTEGKHGRSNLSYVYTID